MKRPTKTGYYWARSSQRFMWYDLIMEITGEAPFLQMKVIAALSGQAPAQDVVLDAVLFGPKIRVPELQTP